METLLIRVARAILREFAPGELKKPERGFTIMRTFDSTSDPIAYPVTAVTTDKEGHPTNEPLTLVAETDDPSILAASYSNEDKTLTLTFGTTGDTELRLIGYGANGEKVGDYREIARLVPGATAAVGISVNWDAGTLVPPPAEPSPETPA